MVCSYGHVITVTGSTCAKAGCILLGFALDKKCELIEYVIVSEVIQIQVDRDFLAVGIQFQAGEI